MYIFTLVRAVSLACFAIVVFLLFSNAALANLTEEDYFDELSRIPANYKVFGTVCEEMARIDLEKEFPKDFYDIRVGIQYRDNSRTIGELDIIVFRRSDEEAVLIGEVKCWRNLKGALKKANRQLNRFQDNCGRGGQINYVDREFEYHWSQFDEVQRYWKISQLGGRKEGFDRVLTLDLEAIKRLHGRLLSCQSNGQCARPR